MVQANKTLWHSPAHVNGYALETLIQLLSFASCICIATLCILIFSVQFLPVYFYVVVVIALYRIWAAVCYCLVFPNVSIKCTAYIERAMHAHLFWYLFTTISYSIRMFSFVSLMLLLLLFLLVLTLEAMVGFNSIQRANNRAG